MHATTQVQKASSSSEEDTCGTVLELVIEIAFKNTLDSIIDDDLLNNTSEVAVHLNEDSLSRNVVKKKFTVEKTNSLKHSTELNETNIGAVELLQQNSKGNILPSNDMKADSIKSDTDFKLITGNDSQSDIHFCDSTERRICHGVTDTTAIAPTSYETRAWSILESAYQTLLSLKDRVVTFVNSLLEY
ncbi:unnamed protein product [Trichobilharzia szidati]|nr:unnamed protein product [Trichobilharzia szidati]